MPKPQSFKEWLVDIKMVLALFWVVVIKRQPLFGRENLKTIITGKPPNPPPPGTYWIPQSIFRYGDKTTWAWMEVTVPDNKENLK